MYFDRMRTTALAGVLTAKIRFRDEGDTGQPRPPVVFAQPEQLRSADEMT
jgi:hypothetical protein